MSRVAAAFGACLLTFGLMLLGDVASGRPAPAVGEILPGVAPPPSDVPATDPATEPVVTEPAITTTTTEPEIVAVGLPPVPPTTLTTTTTTTTLVASLPVLRLPATG